MRKQTRTTLAKTEVVGPEITMNVELGSADVVAIAVSRAETQLKKDLAEQKALYKAEKATAEKAKKDRLDLVKSTGEMMVSEFARGLEVALQGTGTRIDRNWCPALSLYCRQPQPDDEAGSVLTLILKDKGGAGNCVVKTVDVPVTSEMERLTALAAAAEERAKEVLTQVSLLSSRLQDLPSLERAARAQLAEAQLGRSASGREFLAQILANGSELLRLPGV